MREIYKNPMLYYLLGPILVGVWPVVVCAVYLPAAERSAEDERMQCVEGQSNILDILKYDPERLARVGDREVTGEFSYPKAIDRVASLCGMSSANCNYTTGSIPTNSGKRTQNAKVSLTSVGIVQVANFLTKAQTMWVNLKCDKVKLTKKQGLPDQWDAELNFWYTY
jgi:hypothetical protein